MKTSMFIVAYLISQTLLAQPKLSPLHGQDRGGGDVACENRIKQIREDILVWISKGGHKALNLNGRATVESYAKKMESESKIAKIECVAKGDPGFPVLVYGKAKTCAADRNLNGNSITCDFVKVTGHSEDQLYRQVHHEMATLAGIERPSADESEYLISDQISENLDEIKYKRLKVLDFPRDPNAAFNEKIVKVKLKPGYCGEIDVHVVGDACVFRAEDVENRSDYYTIYDSASDKNSDLATLATQHNLTHENNCFIAELYQTKYLIEGYDSNSYFTKILKRISCK